MLGFHDRERVLERRRGGRRAQAIRIRARGGTVVRPRHDPGRAHLVDHGTVPLAQPLRVGVVAHDLCEVSELAIGPIEGDGVQAVAARALDDIDAPPAFRVQVVRSVVYDAVGVESPAGEHGIARPLEADLVAPLVHVVVAVQDEVDLQIDELVEHRLAHAAVALGPDRNALLVHPYDDPRDSAAARAVDGVDDPIVVRGTRAVIVVRRTRHPCRDQDESNEGGYRRIIEVVLEPVPVAGRPWPTGHRHSQCEWTARDILVDVAAGILAGVVVPRDHEHVAELAPDRVAPALFVRRVAEISKSQEEARVRIPRALGEGKHVAAAGALKVARRGEDERGPRSRPCGSRTQGDKL